MFVLTSPPRAKDALMDMTGNSSHNPEIHRISSSPPTRSSRRSVLDIGGVFSFPASQCCLSWLPGWPSTTGFANGRRNTSCKKRGIQSSGGRSSSYGGGGKQQYAYIGAFGRGLGGRGEWGGTAPRVLARKTVHQRWEDCAVVGRRGGVLGRVLVGRIFTVHIHRGRIICSVSRQEARVPLGRGTGRDDYIGENSFGTTSCHQVGCYSSYCTRIWVGEKIFRKDCVVFDVVVDVRRD